MNDELFLEKARQYRKSPKSRPVDLQLRIPPFNAIALISIALAAGLIVAIRTTEIPRSAELRGFSEPSYGSYAIVSGANGIVRHVYVQPGTDVNLGAPLFLVETSYAETIIIRSQEAGKIAHVFVQKDSRITDEALAWFWPSSSPIEAAVYVPIDFAAFPNGPVELTRSGEERDLVDQKFVEITKRGEQTVVYPEEVPYLSNVGPVIRQVIDIRPRVGSEKIVHFPMGTSFKIQLNQESWPAYTYIFPQLRESTSNW